MLSKMPASDNAQQCHVDHSIAPAQTTRGKGHTWVKSRWKNPSLLGQFSVAINIEAFFTFAQAEQHREAQELISAENLNAEAARRYITASLRREFASDNGTELNAVLPKLSPLNPQYLSKKQSVFQKSAAFVDKFKGVGGQV